MFVVICCTTAVGVNLLLMREYLAESDSDLCSNNLCAIGTDLYIYICDLYVKSRWLSFISLYNGLLLIGCIIHPIKRVKWHLLLLSSV
jgi:hypothetical protein